METVGRRIGAPIELTRFEIEIGDLIKSVFGLKATPDKFFG